MMPKEKVDHVKKLIIEDNLEIEKYQALCLRLIDTINQQYQINNELKDKLNKIHKEYWNAMVEVVGKDMAYEIVDILPDDD